MSKYAEVRGNFIDDQEFCSIDAWKTDDDNESGTVIAQVDMLSGRVVYVDPDARSDEYAQEVIQHISGLAKEAHPCSVRRLEHLLENVANDICRKFPYEEAKQKLADLGFTFDEMLKFVTLPYEEEYNTNH